jgi:hypothetical protein
MWWYVSPHQECLSTVDRSFPVLADPSPFRAEKDTCSQKILPVTFREHHFVVPNRAKPGSDRRSCLAI